jgi:hypothetical protein
VPNDISLPNLSLLGHEPMSVLSSRTTSTSRWLLTFTHANDAASKRSHDPDPAPSQFTNIDDHCYNAQPVAASCCTQPSDITPYCKFDTLTNSYLIKNIEVQSQH